MNISIVQRTLLPLLPAANSVMCVCSYISADISSTESSSSASTATATTSAAASTERSSSTAAASAQCKIFEPRRQLLIVLFHQIEQITKDSWLALINECNSSSFVSCTTCTTNAMNIIVDVIGKIEVDDATNIRNIETARGNISRDKNGALEQQ